MLMVCEEVKEFHFCCYSIRGLRLQMHELSYVQFRQEIQIDINKY